MLTIIIFTIVFLGIDLISKVIVSNLLEVYDSVKVINNFFYISYVKNTGAAWSMFSNSTWFVILLSLIIIVCLFIYIYKNKPGSLMEKISYSMILGGALGNFLDRIIYGYVIDFLDFMVFGYDYPIFNLADTFIVIGVIMLLICTWRCRDGNKC